MKSFSIKLVRFNFCNFERVTKILNDTKSAWKKEITEDYGMTAVFDSMKILFARKSNTSFDLVIKISNSINRTV